jgi:hypothetical protein
MGMQKESPSRRELLTSTCPAWNMSKAPSIYTILASAGGLCRDTGNTRSTPGQLRASTGERARRERANSDKPGVQENMPGSRVATAKLRT